MAEATDSGESAPTLIPMVPSGSHVEMTQHPGSSHTSQQVKNEVTSDRIIMIQEHEDGVLLPDCCRVPTILHHLKEGAYTPQVVSIGPFYRGIERLQDMEMHKQIMFKRFTQRAGLSKDDLVRFVKPFLVSGMRASYPKTIDLHNTQDLIDMILLDAGFIIELFMRHKKKDCNDAKLSQPWLMDSIVHDLLLLENQLPFFVIEHLFKRAFPGNYHGGGTSFLELTNEFFRYVHKQQVDLNRDVKIKHFTDLLRLSYLQRGKPKLQQTPKDGRQQTPEDGRQQTPKDARQQTPKDGSHILSYNANALQEAGIKLRDNRESKFILDLKFSGHILQIPQILVDDNTELLFRNMIALEQCHYPNDAYITDYVLLLDWLIDTDKDVELLIRKKIVRNYLGDANIVASLINGLSDNVVQSTINSDFLKICKGLNDYCENRWHKLKANLRHDYCRTPWQGVASTAAIVLLLLTLVQTVFSILQVVN